MCTEAPYEWYLLAGKTTTGASPGGTASLVCVDGALHRMPNVHADTAIYTLYSSCVAFTSPTGADHMLPLLPINRTHADVSGHPCCLYFYQALGIYDVVKK